MRVTESQQGQISQHRVHLGLNVSKDGDDTATVDNPVVHSNSEFPSYDLMEFSMFHFVSPVTGHH